MALQVIVSAEGSLLQVLGPWNEHS